MSAITYENQVLKWQPDGGGNHRFTVINITVLMVLLSFALFLSSVELPPKERSEHIDVPERVAQFILRKEKSQPKPKPAPKPEVKLEPKVEPVPKPKPERLRKPKSAENNTPLTNDQKKIIEKAKQSGLLALSNELADLMDTSDVSAMLSGKINQTPGSSNMSKMNTDVLAIGQKKTVNAARAKVKDHSPIISVTKLSDQEPVEVAQTLMKEVGVAAGQKNSIRKSNSNAASGNFRSDEDIAYVMDQNKGKLYTVYRRARRANPGLKGRIVFDITILPSGKVSEVIIRSSELNDPKLERRLLARVKSFNFGEREGGSISVIYPVEFLPS